MNCRFLLPLYVGCAATLLISPAAGAATWTAGNGDYGQPSNWDIVAVPCLEFLPVAPDVIIDTAVIVSQDVALCTAQSLTLGAGATLSLLPGTQYNASSTDIAGWISGIGGNITGLGTIFSGNDVRIDASLGSVVDFDAGAWNATGSQNSSINRIAATTPGSIVSLPSLADLNAGFNSSSLATQQHTVLADDGGTVDLSGLASVTGPLDEEDRLRFLVNAADATMLLDSVSTVSTHVLFEALNGGSHNLPALSDAGARFIAESGAQILANTSSWSASDLGLRNTSLDIIRAVNVGSLLDLSGMTSLDAGFNSSSLATQQHTVLADDGGTVDLSGLTDISGPIDEEDRLIFRVNASDATMLLDSVSTVGTRVIFQALNGGDHDLPSLSDVGARFVAESGSQIFADVSSWTLTDLGLPNTTVDILRAINPGSLLDLSGMTTLNGGFNSSSLASQQHTVLADDSGTVDLSGLTDISGPIDEEDRLNFLVNAVDATMLLDSVSTVGSRVVFRALNGGSHDLPALSDVGARFDVETGAQILANVSSWTLNDVGLPNSTLDILRAVDPGSLLDLSGMTTLNGGFNSSSLASQQHTVLADDSGTVDLSGLTDITGPLDEEDRLNFLVNSGSATMRLDSVSSVGSRVVFQALGGGMHDLPSLSNTGSIFIAESGSQIFANASSWSLNDLGLRNSSLDIIRASNSGSLLDLSGMTTLNAAFNSASLAAQVHTVRASDSGTVDLSGLDSITGPLDAEDGLAFVAENGGTLIIGPLASVTDNRRVSLTLDPAGARLELPRSLDADSTIEVVAGADSTVAVTGDLSFRHVTETRFDLELARVSVEGVAPPDIEIGGENLGATLPAQPNFGFAQLIVGSPGQTTTARLIDAVDNGNGNVCAAAGIDREALYLYGFDAGPDADGLRVLNNSTLQLGGLDLYAAIGGVLMHINPMLTPGVPFPYDEGFIESGTPFDIDLDGVADSVDNCVLEPNPNQLDSDADGYGNACDGDLNGDLFVNGLDLGLFKLAFFSTPASPNWNPNADFNDDLQVNAQDLGILKLLFLAPPGPACPVPVP